MADDPPRPFYKNPYLLGLLVGCALLTVMRPIALSFRSAPPPLIEVGPWQLTNHEGRPFGSADLNGKVYLASFFFTSCPSVCPQLTKAMQELEERVRNEPQIALVSVTVDPETDTPAVLQAYRAKHGITTDRWNFLTGSREELVRVMVEQMKLHMGDKEPVAGISPDENAQRQLYDISHIAKLALFDQNGDLRALASTDPHGLARLLDAAELLVEKGPGA